MRRAMLGSVSFEVTVLSSIPPGVSRLTFSPSSVWLFHWLSSLFCTDWSSESCDRTPKGNKWRKERNEWRKWSLPSSPRSWSVGHRCRSISSTRTITNWPSYSPLSRKVSCISPPASIRFSTPFCPNRFDKHSNSSWPVRKYYPSTCWAPIVIWKRTPRDKIQRFVPLNSNRWYRTTRERARRWNRPTIWRFNKAWSTTIIIVWAISPQNPLWSVNPLTNANTPDYRKPILLCPIELVAGARPFAVTCLCSAVSDVNTK